MSPSLDHPAIVPFEGRPIIARELDNLLPDPYHAPEAKPHDETPRRCWTGSRNNVRRRSGRQRRRPPLTAVYHYQAVVMPDWKLLQKKLGVKFSNLALLQQALVHRSYLNEMPERHTPPSLCFWRSSLVLRQAFACR